MANCVMCGAPIPDDQGSSSCSMCYGDIDHGKDGYYRDFMEQDRPMPEPEEGTSRDRKSPNAAPAGTSTRREVQACLP